MRAEKTAGQRGGVLILFALCLVVLIGFAGLVIDLGATYVGKTELQNAADASALAGAKQLNGTAAGVAAALQTAKTMANLNKYRFAKSAVAFTDADVWIGDCPSDSCLTTLAAGVTSDAVASGKYFLKVDTGSRSFDTTFMKVANIATTSARAVAVAGRYSWPIAPLGICALDENQCPDKLPGGECGFTRTLTYNLNDINRAVAPSGIGPGDQIWIDPVATNAGECNGSTDFDRPFMCQGKTNIAAEIGSTVYTNTGNSNSLLASLDSRFGDYAAAGQCDPATAPPDANVQGYLWNKPGGQLPASENVQEDWAVTAPTTQSAQITSAAGAKPITTDSNGVRWTYSRPAAPTSTWVNSNYPATGTPYSTVSGKYFKAPTTGTPKAGRRLLNVVVVSCNTVGGTCRPATVKGVGEFFMTRRTNIPGDRNIYLEFSRFIDTSKLSSKEVKLYR
ncbi:MAG TPA: Tad domain-containing protein [Rhodocyclaceae bacterium]|nr:Tad domain-containing protein [Rhodocyclaceae bacterium]